MGITLWLQLLNWLISHLKALNWSLTLPSHHKLVPRMAKSKLNTNRIWSLCPPIWILTWPAQPSTPLPSPDTKDGWPVFGGSVHRKVSKDLETAVNLGWTAAKNETSFGIGAKLALDKDAAVHAKINNSSQIGLGYQQKLRDGVTVTLSTLIDGKNFQAGGHKVGLALELEA